MRVRVFQPFQKVWTPRTPDTGYDSLGIYPPPSPIVMVPATTTDANAALLIETINTTITLAPSSYFAATRITGAIEAVGCSTKFSSGTYTA